MIGVYFQIMYQLSLSSNINSSCSTIRTNPMIMVKGMLWINLIDVNGSITHDSKYKGLMQSIQTLRKNEGRKENYEGVRLESPRAFQLTLRSFAMSQS